MCIAAHTGHCVSSRHTPGMCEPKAEWSWEAFVGNMVLKFHFDAEIFRYFILYYISWILLLFLESRILNEKESSIKIPSGVLSAFLFLLLKNIFLL